MELWITQGWTATTQSIKISEKVGEILLKMDLANTSGQGKLAVVPAEVKKWNWGAFLLSWIWGLANQVYISFLVFVPIIGLVMLILLGAKGNEWAWQKKRWESVEHFNRVQKKWSIWGAVVVIVVLMVPAIVALNASITAVSQLRQSR